MNCEGHCSSMWEQSKGYCQVQEGEGEREGVLDNNNID